MHAPDLPIVTDRLILRPFTPADATAVHAVRSHPDVNRFLYSQPLSMDEARAFVSERGRWTEFREEGDWIDLAIEVASAGTIVGDVLLGWTSAQHRQGEVGFVLHPEHRGQGFATEAAGEMLRLGFEGLDLHRIVARCDGRNRDSVAVMERLGMRREAWLVENEFVKGEWTDEVVYALLEREWKAP